MKAWLIMEEDSAQAWPVGVFVDELEADLVLLQLMKRENGWRSYEKEEWEVGVTGLPARLRNNPVTQSRNSSAADDHQRG